MKNLLQIATLCIVVIFSSCKRGEQGKEVVIPASNTGTETKKGTEIGALKFVLKNAFMKDSKMPFISPKDLLFEYGISSNNTNNKTNRKVHVNMRSDNGSILKLHFSYEGQEISPQSVSAITIEEVAINQKGENNTINIWSGDQKTPDNIHIDLISYEANVLTIKAELSKIINKEVTIVSEKTPISSIFIDGKITLVDI